MFLRGVRLRRKILAFSLWSFLQREEWSTLQETSAEPPLVTDSLASLTLSSPKPEEGRVYPGLPGGECLEILYWLYAVP